MDHPTPHNPNRVPSDKSKSGIKKRFFDDPFRRSPRDYLIMFRERWYYGVIPAIIIMATMIFLESGKKELFETYASLVFEPKSERLLDEYKIKGDSFSKVEMNNHLEKIASQSFFKYFTAYLTEEDRERIKEPYIDYENPENTQSVGSIIRPGLGVSQIRETSIVRLYAQHRDPQMAQFLADLIARKYIDYNMDESKNTTDSGVVFLTREEKKLKDELEAVQQEIQEYRAEHNLAKLGDNQNIFTQRSNTLDGQLIAAEIERLDYSTRFDKVRTYKENNENLIELPDIATYGNIPSFKTQLENLKQEFAILDQKYLENHPLIKTNRTAMASTQNLIDGEITQAIIALETLHTIAVEREAQIKQSKESADSELLALDEISVKYDLLTNKADTIRTGLSDVQIRLSELSIASRMNNTNITLNDPAYEPYRPIEPNMPKAFIQSVILGLLLIMILPLGFGVFDTRLKSSWEIEDLLDSRLIGEVPKLSSVKKKDRPVVVIKDLSEVASESFRGIFSQFEIIESGNTNGIILITSTLPNEGKSLIASNLAATFANHGKKSLLIDFDMRRPSLHSNFDIKNSHGVLKWLKEPNSSLDSITEDPHLGITEYCPNFYLLRTGGINRKPTELFNQEKLNQLLLTLREQFDIIILDTPPVGLFPDALLLAQKSDFIFYVCRFNKVSMFKIQHFVDKLKETNCILSGLILNGIPAGRASGYYHYYGYGSYSNYEYKNYYKPKKRAHGGGRKPKQPKAAAKTAAKTA
ncbi:MAG: polysaccharide biosynthesis tyrosine autokinase [Opitutales bacterium]|nr:polysaccharide biosynthesis tyrosine autokinase [Opitutales bacterium]